MANNKIIYEVSEKSRLTLRTSDIYYFQDPNAFNEQAYNIDNQIGEIKGNGGYIRFKNIKWSEVLGDLYNKYDKFIMVLNCTCERITTGYLSAEDVIFSIFVNFDSLIYSNGNYDTIRGKNINMACFGSERMPYYAGAFNNPLNANYYKSRRIIINKPPQYSDITIDLKNSSNNVVNGINEKNAPNIIGMTTLVFDFYPIKTNPIYRHLNNNSYFSMDYKHIKNNLLN